MSATASKRESVDLIEFVAAPPGFYPRTSFTLDPIADADGIFALRSVDKEVRLFVLDPAVAALEYQPRIPLSLHSEIGTQSVDDVDIYVVLNPSEDGVFVNLRAPIVINRLTRQATQAILDEQDYPLRMRLK